MTQSKDDDWIDAIAGRPSSGLNASEQRLAQAIRDVTRAQHEQDVVQIASDDLAQEERLVQHARRTDPVRVSSSVWIKRVAIAATLILAVGLGWLLIDREAQIDVRGGGQVQIIETSDVQALATRIVSRLEQAGITVQAYPLGTYRGINAALNAEQRAALTADLEKLGVAVPANGVLTLEIRDKQ